jgi:hypothetical protein
LSVENARRRKLLRNDGKKMSRRTRKPGILRSERHVNGKSEKSVRGRIKLLVRETGHQDDGKAIQLLHLVPPPPNLPFPRYRLLLL